MGMCVDPKLGSVYTHQRFKVWQYMPHRESRWERQCLGRDRFDLWYFLPCTLAMYGRSFLNKASMRKPNDMLRYAIHICVSYYMYMYVSTIGHRAIKNIWIPFWYAKQSTISRKGGESSSFILTFSLQYQLVSYGNEGTKKQLSFFHKANFRLRKSLSSSFRWTGKMLSKHFSSKN